MSLNFCGFVVGAYGETAQGDEGSGATSGRCRCCQKKDHCELSSSSSSSSLSLSLSLSLKGCVAKPLFIMSMLGVEAAEFLAVRGQNFAARGNEWTAL